MISLPLNVHFQKTVIRERRKNMKKIVFPAIILVISIVFSSIPAFAFQNDNNTSRMFAVVSEFFSDDDNLKICGDDISITDIHKLRSIRNDNDSLYIVSVSDGSNNAYVVLDIERNYIIEFAETNSPYAQYYESSKELYYAPMCYIAMTQENRFINTLTGVEDNSALDTLNGRDDFIDFTANNRYNRIPNNPVRSYPSSAYIINVPSYAPTTTYGDICTSIYNILEYWESQDEDYDDLLLYTVNQERAIINSLFSAAGGVYRANIQEVVEEFVSSRGYSTYVETYYNPDFDDYRYEITYTYPTPCVVGISNNYSHIYYNGTGVGYQVIGNNNFATIHNWGATGTNFDVNINFNEVNFLASIII